MLPQSWIERIFARMLVRYGTAWTRAYEGIDAALLHEDWAYQLAGFESAPELIKHALENLPPDRPPTSGQFKQACLNAPRAMPKLLEAPKARPEVVSEELGKMKRWAREHDPRAWAHALREREERGDRLTQFQRQCWREALASAPDNASNPNTADMQRTAALKEASAKKVAEYSARTQTGA